VTREADGPGTRPQRPDGGDLEALRPLLFSIAYRMRASVSQAEDLVQEAFLRYQRALAGGTAIESPKAYLSAVVTRLAIDELRSARAARETYVGQWLPEPLLTDGDGPEAATERADSLSMAFLVLLERLNPVERAVFLLHDVFGYGFAEVADIVERTEVNCRQIARRARRAIEAARPRFEASREERDRLARRFFAAVTDGDVDGLVDLLAADVVVVGDGGGKAAQWSVPIVGAERAARVLASVGRRVGELAGSLELREVNGQPGALVRAADGHLVNVFALDIADGRVQAVRSVINPDKLGHIGPTADVWALLRGDRDDGDDRSHRGGGS
jgi:RNA polymerase sigma-70 factor, ECF subfamily